MGESRDFATALNRGATFTDWKVAGILPGIRQTRAAPRRPHKRFDFDDPSIDLGD
jgi:hypothetical protein